MDHSTDLDDSVTALLIPCIVVKELAGLFDQANLVRLTGFEPVTLRLSSACSNQLSYRRSFKLVELRRFELLTYSLQSYRSTN